MYSYAQTNIQLFNQLQDSGYEPADLAYVCDAYSLAMCLFTGCFRQSGKSFISHLVGTASILVECRAPATTVAAGLLHSAYSHGEFGTGARGISAAKRKQVQPVAGVEAEHLVAQYTTSPWDEKTISALLKNLPGPGTVAREVLLIHLANELEDHLDSAALYSGSAEYRRGVIKSYLFQCIEIAERIGYPALASELSRAFDETLSREVQLTFQKGSVHLTHKDTVHLIGWKSSFLFPPATHRLRLKVRLGRMLRRWLPARLHRLRFHGSSGQQSTPMTLPVTRQDKGTAGAAGNELVSVIIPCYNQGRFLGQAIESVMLQSFPNFEVIVVDDGSTDNTREVAALYSEVRVVPQEHVGISAARNRGVSESKGSWLVFLDSDDRLLPDALTLGLQHFRDHVECAFVFGRHQEINADGTGPRTTPFVSAEKDPYRQLLLYNCVYTPSTAMFRRDAFDAVGGFDQRFAGAEDYDLYLRLARKYPLFSYDEVVAEYRRHDANMSGDNAHMLRVCLEVMREQRPRVLENKDWEEAYHTGISNWRKLWGEQLVSQVWSRAKKGKEWRRSARDMMELMRYGPAVFPRQLGRKLVRPLKAALSHNGLRDVK